MQALSSHTAHEYTAYVMSLGIPEQCVHRLTQSKHIFALPFALSAEPFTVLSEATS